LNLLLKHVFILRFLMKNLSDGKVFIKLFTI
jgi:hypothetical protein